MKKVRNPGVRKTTPAGSVELDERQLDVSAGATSAPAPLTLVMGKGPVPTFKLP